MTFSQSQVRTLVAQPSEQGRAPAEVTRLVAAPGSPHVAAGHADGTIRIWNLDTGDCEVRAPSQPARQHGHSCPEYIAPQAILVEQQGMRWPEHHAKCRMSAFSGREVPVRESIGSEALVL